MPDASIIIVTRNRRDKVGAAVESALSQAGDNEVLVFDDASSDGTSDYVHATFPAVHVHRTEEQVGLVVQRNRAADVARGRVLINLDDDAVFTDPQAVADTVKLFDADPRIGATTIPHYNVGADGNRTLFLFEAPDDGEVHLLPAFAGGSSAIRRDVFNEIGGLQGRLFHWGEETEFCQRMIGFGYVVRCGPKARVLHYPEGAGKYTRKTNRFIYRNKILTPWFNAPVRYLWPIVLKEIAASVVEGLRRPSKIPAIVEGLAMGFGGMFRYWNQRRAVPAERYRLWWRIRANPLITLRNVSESLGG